MDGAHVSVVLLTVGAAEGLLTGSIEFFTECLEKLKDGFLSFPTGLYSSYLSVLADSRMQHALQSVSNSRVRSLLGRWHSLSPTPRSPGGHLQSADELEDITALLSSVSKVNLSPCSSTACWSKLATQIHGLLDKSPWKPAEHVVVDIHWLLAGSCPPSPSSVVELYGCMLRLQEWYNAYVQLVCRTGQNSFELQEWRDMLDTPPVRCLSSWLITPGVIWRGALHFTEHKVPKLGKLSSVGFPGFSLSLRSEELEEGVTPAVLEAVGLSFELVHPSHLEVINAVNLTSFPHFWRSPVQCSLLLDNPSFQSSAVIMRHILSRQQNKTIGLLVRFCFKEGNGLHSSRSTSNWMAYVQEKEEPETASRSPSPLGSYLPGPLLLVCPSDQSDSSTLSCDAWFLWKPESLSATVLGCTEPLPIAADDTTAGEDVLLSSPPNPIAMATDPLDEFWKQLTTVHHELDNPPSDWPEMRALQTHEWIQSKVIHRLATPDLMFGQMVAPPPTAAKEATSAGDLLSYFKESGSPVVSELSPIAMSDPSMRIYDPGTGNVSYEAIAASTPSSKKNYHGVSYCLSSADTSLDSRLTKVQQRYLVSERASNCSTSNSPVAERQRKRRVSQMLESSSTGGGATGAKGTTSSSIIQTKEHSKLTVRVCTSPVAKRSAMKMTSSARNVSALIGSKSEQSASELRGHGEEAIGWSKAAAWNQDSTAGGDSSPAVVDSEATQSTSVGDPQPDLPHVQSLRRSPRLTKLKAAAEKLDDCTAGLGKQGPSSSGDANGRAVKKLRTSPRKSKPTLKKSESSKKRLEKIIVATLKKNSMPRSHPCFRKCYMRLFNLSKSFLKDIKSSGRLDSEMERVVGLNVAQVIDFEQRQVGIATPGTSTGLEQQLTHESQN